MPRSTYFRPILALTHRFCSPGGSCSIHHKCSGSKASYFESRVIARDDYAAERGGNPTRRGLLCDTQTADSGAASPALDHCGDSGGGSQNTMSSGYLLAPMSSPPANTTTQALWPSTDLPASSHSRNADLVRREVSSHKNGVGTQSRPSAA